jgi:hypothetical protein
VIIDSPTEHDKPAREIKPLTTYALDEVDVDDLSDSSSTASSPTNRVRRSTIRAVNLEERGTPPTSPSKKSKTHTPDTPTTPLAPSPSKPLPTGTTADSERTSTAPVPAPLTGEPTRSRSLSTVESGSKEPANVDSSKKWYASAYTEAQLRTFHCDKIKKIPLSNVDPSMLLGFLCKNEADFEDFCERVSKVRRQSGSGNGADDQMPRKIFTVQDEPPTWDDNDDPGMESVSDASSGREQERELETKSIHSVSTHGTPIASPIPIPIPEFNEDQNQAQGLETLRDEDGEDGDDFDTSFNDTITRKRTEKNAKEIEANSGKLAATKQPAIAWAEAEAEGQMGHRQVETQKPRPPKPRPLQSMGPVGTDSWIRPGVSGEAAPNGRSVI